MEFRNKTKTIDGIKFVINEFPAFEAFKLHRQLIKILAPSIGALVEGLDMSDNTTLKEGAKSLLETKVSGESFTKAVNNLMDQLDEDSYLKLVKKLLKYTHAYINRVDDTGKTVQEQPVNLYGDKFETYFNIVFHEKPFTVYKVIAFVLEVNFPDFFNNASDSGE
jgi:hypothetical protein